ncbi:MAG: amidohydrolase family protein [Candidatus Methanomethyliaceae archaeon]
MAVIDCHAHVGPVIQDPRLNHAFASNQKGTVEDYLRAMDKAGVDIGVTFGFLDLNTEYQAEIQRKHSDRIISLAFVNPRLPNAVSEFRRAVEEWGIRGLKLHGWWHQFSNADHVLLDPLCEICAQYGLPIVMHVMADGLTSPLQAEEMARTFPNVTFFMSHAGGFWAYSDALLVAKRTPNIIIDTSAMESWWITHFVQELGANRVAMGSDWPWNHLEAIVKTIEISVPRPEDREWVMGKTAAKAFGIPV